MVPTLSNPALAVNHGFMKYSKKKYENEYSKKHLKVYWYKFRRNDLSSEF